MWQTYGKNLVTRFTPSDPQPVPNCDTYSHYAYTSGLHFEVLLRAVDNWGNWTKQSVSHFSPNPQKDLIPCGIRLDGKRTCYTNRLCARREYLHQSYSGRELSNHKWASSNSV